MELNETEEEIKESLEEGYSNDEIIEALREDGFSDEEINQMIVDVKQKLKENRNQEEEDKNSGMEAPPSSSNQTNKSFEDSQISNEVTETQLNYASLGQRAIAKILDGIIASLLFGLAFGIPFIPVLPDGVRAVSFVFTFVLAPFLPFIYFVLMEGRSGATLGKKFEGIKVVKADGSKIGYKEALIRNVLLVVDQLPTLYLLGIYFIKSSEDSQRLGDRVADTVVIRSE